MVHGWPRRHSSGGISVADGGATRRVLVVVWVLIARRPVTTAGADRRTATAIEGTDATATVVTVVACGVVVALVATAAAV